MDANLVLTTTAGNLIGGGLNPSRAFHTLCAWFAMHPEGQERLFNELKEADITFPTQFDDVSSLPYLDGIIHEAYRLHTWTSVNLQRVTGGSGLRLPNETYLTPWNKCWVPGKLH